MPKKKAKPFSAEFAASAGRLTVVQATAEIAHKGWRTLTYCVRDGKMALANASDYEEIT